MRFLPLFVFFCVCCSLFAQQESDYYVLTKVNIPEAIKLEVGGMDFMPDGRLAVCTRRGEVWLIGDMAENEPTYQLFARGLHEPLGLAVKDGAIYVSQRGEVTKLEDTNNDDRADVFVTVYELPLTGNYHEYHYGPLFRPDGSMLSTLNVGWEGGGVSRVPWRGWMMRYDNEENKLVPYAAGLRSPAGFGTNIEGDVFVAENQGDWIGSGRITHLEEGDFAGHKASLNWADQPGSKVTVRPDDINDDYKTMYAARAKVPGVKLPAVWFPHGILGISTAAIIADRTEGGFGPFAGQLFVSDQGQSKIMRVAMEKVDGEYQGAVFPFREGFSSGLLRLNFDKNNVMYAGQTARGWSATGGEQFALEGLEWTGDVPFEMNRIKATEEGFDVEFTLPVNPVSVKASAFTIQNFTYIYHHNYGSPVVDIEDNKITSATVLPDGKTVRLVLDKLRPGYIYEVKLKGPRAADGTNLLHDFGYYTLNAIPGGAAAGAVEAGGAVAAEKTAAKRPTTMPPSWNGKVDEELLLETEHGMKFKQTFITVKAGQNVRLTFRNPDDMQHNFVLTSGKKGDVVGKAADGLGLKGLASGYIPEIDEVLVHTGLIEPEESDVIYFTTPSKPGLYEFVCTVPGHYMSMRGVLQVE
ncbi:plastocyanin/azurin family copper-binding protein [Neolewinella persica]|uniref:plastocyanin/azurin family copper-binding protein n=1 Tax=Neolewinella persica TaxID=70998 RepID=UPI00035F35FA|nr:plastocyanin/azurin family copper-binding protein [Neolewinella persica]